MNWREDREEEAKERKRLEKMSVEQLRDEFNERMRVSLIEAIEKLPERINAHLDDSVEEIITAALGVKKDSWNANKWEIDTHNPKSAVAIELGQHVMAQVKLAIPDFIKGLVIGDPRIPPIKTAYTKAYKEHLAELFNRKTWEIAHAAAEKRFVKIMEDISKGKVPEKVLKDELAEEVDEDVVEGNNTEAEQEKEET